MAAKKTHDAAVKLREYQNRDGDTKGEWLNVGAIIEYDEGGRALLLNRHFNPAGLPDPDGRGSVRISLFPVDRQQRQGDAYPPRHDEQGQNQGGYQGQGYSAPSQGATFDDDIPFGPVSAREMG